MIHQDHLSKEMYLLSIKVIDYDMIKQTYENNGSQSKKVVLFQNCQLIFLELSLQLVSWGMIYCVRR